MLNSHRNQWYGKYFSCGNTHMGYHVGPTHIHVVGRAYIESSPEFFLLLLSSSIFLFVFLFFFTLGPQQGDQKLVQKGPKPCPERISKTVGSIVMIQSLVKAHWPYMYHALVAVPSNHNRAQKGPERSQIWSRTYLTDQWATCHNSKFT